LCHNGCAVEGRVPIICPKIDGTARCNQQVRDFLMPSISCSVEWSGPLLAALVVDEGLRACGRQKHPDRPFIAISCGIVKKFSPLRFACLPHKLIPVQAVREGKGKAEMFSALFID
jgi:hypothetical protein